MAIAVVIAGLGLRNQVDRIRLLGSTVPPPTKLDIAWSEDKLHEMLEAANPYRQAALFASISRQDFGLESARDLLGVLERCEPLVKEDPARGAYWRRRHELEEALKQEMNFPGRNTAAPAS